MVTNLFGLDKDLSFGLQFTEAKGLILSRILQIINFYDINLIFMFHFSIIMDVCRNAKIERIFKIL